MRRNRVGIWCRKLNRLSFNTVRRLTYHTTCNSTASVITNACVQALCYAAISGYSRIPKYRAPTIIPEYATAVMPMEPARLR